jgi:26S proteasome regulatory subunit N9
LYHNFLADFELKVNPLSLAQILLYISKEIDTFEDMVSFIEGIKDKVKHSEEAKILCMVAIGDIRMSEKDYQQVKVIMEEAYGMLEGLNGITKAHAPYYNLSITYHKSQGSHASYYRDALRYLGCVDVREIPLSEQVERAYHLALSGLLAEDIYNFGELLAHPILDSLRNTDKQWLVDLLLAFNTGDLMRMKGLEGSWKLQPDLRDNESKLNQKIRLLSLMNLTFTHPANERTISFPTIAHTADLPTSDVELLVMKALSLGLVRGTIDEVAQEVHMTWVQPRVLNVEQVGMLHQKMGQWSKSVNSTVNHVQLQAKDLISSQATF